MVRLYVIGHEGQVARSLREAAATNSKISLFCSARSEVDISRPEQIEKALITFRPDIVINPAAYSAVDRAEIEQDLAFAINRDGAKNVAAIANRLNLPVIHFSTDYVFDGQKEGPYEETDSTRPLSVYGHSKLGGEAAVAAANDRHIIIRTSWVYAPFGSNFVRTVLRLSSNTEKLSIVDDQIGCPTYAPDIANATLAIAGKVTCSGWQNQFRGVTHLAGPDAITWCTFARQIVQVAEKKGARGVAVDAITTAEYPTAAVRPANSRLNCQRLSSVFDIRLPPLDSSLERCLERLLGGCAGPRSVS